MQKIIYKTGDGIAIVHPSAQYPIEDVIAKSVPKGAEYVVVDENDIPKDRAFRNAWELDKDKIVINQDKKQAILDATVNKVSLNDVEAAVGSATNIASLKNIIKDLITAIK